MTVGEALREGERRLAEGGIASAAPDAETLLRHVRGWDRARVITASGEEMPVEAHEAYRALISARAEHRPLQHLTGHQAFWRHDFFVSPAVLIPRPETEILVEAAVHKLAGRRSPVVVDVGTGSGCIAVSLAAELRDARIIAVDISREALAVARRNAERAGVAERVQLLEGDLLEPLGGASRVLDAVVSNPPYVDASERASLAPEVRDHEPAAALFAPQERFSVYRRLIPAAHRQLCPDGFLLLEVGIGMAEGVAELCQASGFVIDEVRPDLQSIPRVVVARVGASP